LGQAERNTCQLSGRLKPADVVVLKHRH
jgi:hypothetical protein